MEPSIKSVNNYYKFNSATDSVSSNSLGCWLFFPFEDRSPSSREYLWRWYQPNFQCRCHDKNELWAVFWLETFIIASFNKNELSAVFIVRFDWWLQMTRNMKWVFYGLREITLKSKRECIDSCRIDVLRKLDCFVATKLCYVATETCACLVVTQRP